MRAFLVVSASFIAALSLSAAPAAKSATPAKSAFDKKNMEAYVRHLFVWPAEIDLQVSEPKPSDVPGFSIVTVRASKGAAHQEERFYVSKDGQRIFQMQGNYYQIAKNPYQEQLSKLKTEGHPGFGTPGAPVVIAEFSDFQCHYCREEAKNVRQNLLKDYPKEVRFYFLDFPLEAVHPWAKTAAIAGRCVYRQNADAFWEYHDWIFEQQEQITPENIRERVLDWAKSAKVDAAQLTSCIDTRATEPEVAQSIAMGQALEVGSTPTLYINGRPLSGAIPWADLKRVVDYEVGYQAVEKNAGENCGCEVTIPKTGVK